MYHLGTRYHVSAHTYMHTLNHRSIAFSSFILTNCALHKLYSSIEIPLQIPLSLPPSLCLDVILQGLDGRTVTLELRRNEILILIDMHSLYDVLLHRARARA